MKRFLALAAVLTLLMSCFPAAAESAPRNWYEVFVYSFRDSDGDGVGDLPGLESKLDYIADMGFNGLWLMPVMPSPSYHKYDVTDYCAIDPQYGTLADFKRLVQACHERDIRIVIDLPLNHTSTEHPWFVQASAALRAGETDNPYVDYYCFSREAGDHTVALADTGWYYEEQFSGGHMPDLNLDSEAVRGEIREILRFWLAECGVDGFRLDAVTSYYAGDKQRNIDFLRQLKAEAEQISPGSYLVGECWKGLSDIAEYYESGIDGFFLFPASQAEGYVAASLRSKKPAATYVKHLKNLLAKIPMRSLAPFLSNHDTGRAVGSLRARSAPQNAKFGHGVLAMMGGNTFTYYGEEIGMIGSGEDPNKRIGMYWRDGEVTTPPPGATETEYFFPDVEAQLADETSILRYVRALNRLKLAHPEISGGENSFVYSDNFVCVMERVLDGAVCRVAINFSAKDAQTVEAAGWRIAGDLETGTESASIADGVLTMPAYAIVILEME